VNTTASGTRDRFRLPPLEDYPGREPYCTGCGRPVGRDRVQGRLAHLEARKGEEAPDDGHTVELGWRPRDGASVTP